MGRRAALLLTLVLAMPSIASAGGVLLAFGTGAGDVNFDSDIAASNNVVSDDDIVGEVWIGYRFDSKVIVEGGGSQGISIDVFALGDSFAIQDFRVMAGYEVQLGERFSFLPELGVSSWKIDTADVRNFIFGSSRRDVDDSGTDLMWRISGEVRVAQRMRLYGAYSAARYDFGDATRVSFGLKWQF